MKLRKTIIMMAVVMLISTLFVACSKEPVEVVFDANQFVKEDGKTVTEKELIKILGKPDDTEKWNYKTGSKSYPVRTLYYGNYEYSFNNDQLQRISINEPIPFKDKDDILKMFGLGEYKNTDIKDNNVSYRAYNCGVHDLWVQIDDDNLTYIKISYGSMFGN